MSFSLFEILIILCVHFISDFVFQSHEMATKKSSSNYWLGYHVLCYTALWPVAWFLLLPGWPNSFMIAFAVVSTFISHFAIDYVSSRLTTKFWKQKKYHNFFVTIGADQLIHLSTLFYILYLAKNSLFIKIGL